MDCLTVSEGQEPGSRLACGQGLPDHDNGAEASAYGAGLLAGFATPATAQGCSAQQLTSPTTSSPREGSKSPG